MNEKTPAIFLDTDVILDLLLKREPHFISARTLFARIETGLIQGFTSALVLWNIYYLVEKYASRKIARARVAKLRILLSILPVDDRIIEQALQSDIKDFEDAVQLFAARSQGIQTLITRNKKDYPKAEIQVMTPREFLETLYSAG